MRKKIISAIGDDFLINNLPEDKFEITGDIFEQEILFDLLKNDYFDWLIISIKINGTHSKYSLIKQLRDINEKLKIIVIIDEEDNEYIKYLESKNINDFFENGKFTFKDILNVLNRVEKDEIIVLNEVNKNDIGETALMAVSPNQQIITVAGTEGAGKSTVLVNLALMLVERAFAKVLIIDLDTINGNINEFLGVSTTPTSFSYFLPDDKNSSLNYLIDFIDKKAFDSDILEKSLIKLKKYENLSVLTGNTSLFVCKNILSYEYYSKILDKAKQLYDFIFIDTSSNIFLDSTQFALTEANKVLFVTEANNVALNRTQRVFNEVYKVWGIDENKLELVFNKFNKYSIEKTIIREIFSKYIIRSFINYDEKYVRQLNTGRPYITDNECLEYEEILEEFNFIRKKTLKERLASGKLFNFTI